MLAPRIAELYAAGDLRALDRLLGRLGRLVLAAGFPVVLGLVLFGRWLLLVFGADFVQGYALLVILSVGQLVNILVGPVATLLTMTGHERDALVGLGISALVKLLLGVALLPLWGAAGVAVAAAAGLIVWNVLLAWFVRRRLGLAPWCVAALRVAPRGAA